METCRLSSSHVRPGVPLSGNVYDEAGHLLLSKGYVPDSQEQVDQLLSRGMYVEVGVFEAHYRAMATDEMSVVENKFDPFLTRDSLKISLNRLLRSILNGLATPDQITDFARQLQCFADTDTEAAMAACLLDHQEESHVASHCLNTAIFTMLMARRLDWEMSHQVSVVCAALTMNLGMFELQQRLQRQSVPLAPMQLEQVQAHPEASAIALEKIGVADPLWLKVVRQHHEKPGGAGYPGKEDNPSVESQLLRLLDVFGARASARADRRPMAPAQIVRTLFVEEGQTHCGALVAAMVKLFGLHPPGSFVKLENNELAVVFRTDTENNSLAVAAVTTATGTPTMQPVRRDTHRKGFSVVGAVTYDKVSVGYDLGKLWISKRRS